MTPAPDKNPMDLNPLEALLKNAADFEPTQRPATDFVGEAIRSQINCRFSRKKVWMLAGSSACMALLAAAPTAIRLTSGKGQIPTVSPNKTVLVHASNKVAKSLSADPGTVATRNQLHTGNDEQVISNEITPVNYVRRRPSRLRRNSAPSVEWQSESVDRYASGLLTPVWHEVTDDQSESTRLEPAMLTEPLEMGENIRQPGVASQGMFSLVSYEGNTNDK